VFVLAEPGNTVDGRTVTFVEPNARLRRFYADWPRTSALLTPP
jgi:hypothetical protein